MGKPRFTIKPQKNILTQEQVDYIAQRVLIDKVRCHVVAKEMLIKPRIVTDVVSTKTHKTMWIDAIAKLGREGKLVG